VHLILSGADPIEVLELAGGRVQQVHLNDIDGDLAEQVRDHGEDYNEAVAVGLFKPLGEGAAKVDRVIEALRGSKYRGWYTLRQETRLASPDDRPLGRVSRSLDYLMPLLS
jgi:inosose dehydratase